MMTTQFTVISPLLLGGQYSEAECLGSAVWLYLHSDNHKHMPLDALNTLLMPAIKRQQFILFFQDNKPVCFVSWAWLNDDDEQHYLAEGSMATLPASSWDGGQRMWVIDWVSPLGHTQECAQYVLKHVLQDFCFCSLYHKEGQTQIKFFKGCNVSHEQAKVWRQSYPQTA